MYRILFVCYGNICRSPMAEFIMKDYVKKKGLADKFYIASSATSYEEIGNPVHYGTRKILDRLNIDCSGKVATKLVREDYKKYDYIIGMDEINIRDITRIFGGDPDGRVFRLKDFSDCPGDIADPYYSGNFEKTYEDIKYGLEYFFRFLLK